MTSAKITVCGSINMDWVVRCGSLPTPGQTVSAESLDAVCGGKGANQAVAAARAGGLVQMIGRVGDDDIGQRLLKNLKQQDVGHQGVQTTRGCTSGVAVVAVEQSGENSILLVAGANAHMNAADVLQFQTLIQNGDVLLLQLEIPTAAVLAAMEIAGRAGVRCILDPAPVAGDWTDELLQVDLICPNQTEAAAITGMSVETIDDATAAARRLHQRGARHVIITLGHRGSVVWTDGKGHHLPANRVKPVDTTAAGDSFAGALAVRWAETDDLIESVQFASAAGAITATGRGAQPSLPTRDQINAMRNTQ